MPSSSQLHPMLITLVSVAHLDEVKDHSLSTPAFSNWDHWREAEVRAGWSLPDMPDGLGILNGDVSSKELQLSFSQNLVTKKEKTQASRQLCAHCSFVPCNFYNHLAPQSLMFPLVRWRDWTLLAPKCSDVLIIWKSLTFLLKYGHGTLKRYVLNSFPIYLSRVSLNPFFFLSCLLASFTFSS